MSVRRMITAILVPLALILGSGTAAVATTTTATATATATANTTAERTYNTWVWNIAGWTMNDSSTTNGLIKAITDSIINRTADFAALNEVCLGQYQAVIQRLRDLGWPEDDSNFARFETSHSTSCKGGAMGNAIFSKAPLGTALRYTLPSDGSSEDRTLLCAPLLTMQKMVFCTTHITPSNAIIDGKNINEQQLDEVHGLMETFNGLGMTAILAGDLNNEANDARLNKWYSSSVNTQHNSANYGSYRELDDTDTRCVGYGETTFGNNDEGPCGLGRKIDFIFVRENRLAGSYDGDSLSISTVCGGPCSDHRIVIGTATVEVNL